MTHYAIIRQPIYEETPFYQEKMSSRYSYMCGRTYKYGSMDYSGLSTYLLNAIVIDESFSGEYKEIFEGKINLNEYKEGDIVEIEDKTYTINEIIKSTSNKITYTVSEKYLIKCDDYDELLEECERKFEEYNADKEVSEEYDVKVEAPKKKGFWARLFG